LIPPTHN